jgi:DNA-binding XRE family transcriptional regulator
MSGHKPYGELRARMPADQRGRAAVKSALLGQLMELKDLRRSRKLTQQAVAKKLKVEQPAIAKLERRGDMRVSTLTDIVEALGGELRLVVRFREGEVTLSNFGQKAKRA